MTQTKSNLPPEGIAMSKDEDFTVATQGAPSAVEAEDVREWTNALGRASYKLEQLAREKAGLASRLDAMRSEAHISYDRLNAEFERGQKIGAEKAERERDEAFKDAERACQRERRLLVQLLAAEQRAEGLERELAEARKPPKVYSTDDCDRHRGQTWFVMNLPPAYNMPAIKTCPVCERDAALDKKGRKDG